MFIKGSWYFTSVIKVSECADRATKNARFSFHCVYIVISQMAPWAVASQTGCSGSRQKARASSATCQSRTLAAAQTWRRSADLSIACLSRAYIGIALNRPPLLSAGERPFQHFRVPHCCHRADEVQPAASGGGGRGGGRQRLWDPAAQTEDSPEEATDPTQPHAAVHNPQWGHAYYLLNEKMPLISHQLRVFNAVLNELTHTLFEN